MISFRRRLLLNAIYRIIPLIMFVINYNIHSINKAWPSIELKGDPTQLVYLKEKKTRIYLYLII